MVTDMLVAGWQVLAQMAPYLLLGFLVAGVLSVVIPASWVERHLGRPGLGPVLTASVVGVPLPLCSCGVIPVAAALRRHGASRAATTSFLLSTPQTGVDSIAVTYALLGPVFAVFRPVAAFAAGLIGGGLVQAMGDRGEVESEPNSNPPACNDGCCTREEPGSSFRRALRHGFITLPKDIAAALLIGILVAAAMTVLIPHHYLAAYVGGGIASILILMAAGVPVYVCATASVPIAVGFIHAGASPGAALAFLIAGPATNAAALSTIWKVLGHRSAVAYLLTVAVSAVLCGLAIDAIHAHAPLAIPGMGTTTGHEDHTNWFSHASAVVLLLVLVASYAHRPARAAKAAPAVDEGTGRVTLVVDGMTCDHCAGRVRDALSACAGVAAVEVNRSTGCATAIGDDLDVDLLVQAMVTIGLSAKAQEPATQQAPRTGSSTEQDR